MSMNVTVKLFASLGKYLPAAAKDNTAPLSMDPDVTISAVLGSLNVPEEHCHLVLVNGVYIEPSARAAHRLSEGDALAVWPPVAGG